VPLGFESAFGVEDLNPVILTVRDVKVALSVNYDIVGDVELAGIGTRLSPGE
jgi:hypothetical protein